MNLKNYTSSVPMLNSISKIEFKLSQAGATHISKEYKEGRPIGMMFQMIADNGNPLTFKLPAKEEKVYDFMIRQKKMGYKKAIQETTRKQAGMTAWKILADWIDIQISMIQLEQAEPIEVFFPYLYSHKEDKTLFQMSKANNYKLLGD